MIDNISIERVPTGMHVTAAMQNAQIGLLSRFHPENPPSVDHIQSMVNNPNSALLFALEDIRGEVNRRTWQYFPRKCFVGTLSLIGLESSTRFSGYIDHVVVDEDHEGHGIGELLVREAIEIGVDMGMTRFDLTSNTTKEAAQRLYRKVGFVTRDTVNWRLEV